MLSNLKKWIGPFTFWKGALAAILLIGAYASYVRFFVGLGASTNLSDEFPWGLWIGFNVLVGVGLGAGGFIIAATVHIFHIEKYESIARPTILTAFLGYILVATNLSYEIGRPLRLWHPLVMWNPHSIMFEVAWCVTLYITVLALEFSPMVFERLGWKLPLKIVRAVYVPLVIVGVLLSTMHQSSLGTMYVIAPDKLHGLWYTPLLPIFFFLSAIAAGLAMTIFQSFLAYRAFGKRLAPELLAGLARVIVVVLSVYAILKTQDLVSRGNFGLVLRVTPESVMFWGEAALGVLLPIVLLSFHRIRASEGGLFFGALLVLMGFMMNRMNVSITGMEAASGVKYFPSFLEVMATLLIFSMGFVAFGLAVKFLNVFPPAELDSTPRLRPAFHGGALAGLWAFVIAGALAVSYASKRQTANTPDMKPDQADLNVGLVFTEPGSLKLPSDHTFAHTDDSIGPAVFRHSTHMGKEGIRCASCHATLFHITTAASPITGKITGERAHEGDLCASCHDGTKAFATDDCEKCHR